MATLKLIRQAVKYVVVGMGNTLLTLLIIFIMMKVFGCGAIESNLAGYAAGFLNSFIWNKRWTFKSADRWGGSAFRFGISAGVCYLLQLGTLIYLDRHLPIDPYFNQLIAMACYTVANFLSNKYFTFKKQDT
ncbi:MAG: cell wall teichoic acid glycosylation protein GtcA [Bacteroidales bacterium]